MLKINISNLDEGVHNFDFLISPEEIEIDSVDVGDGIKINVDLYKAGNQISVKVDINCRLILPCDRCLENYIDNISTSFRLIYKLDYSGQSKDSDDDDIKFISANTRFIDLKDDVKDYFILAIPLRKVPTETDGICSYCNKDISKIFELNRKEDINPVWEKLIKAKTK